LTFHNTGREMRPLLAASLACVLLSRPDRRIAAAFQPVSAPDSKRVGDARTLSPIGATIPSSFGLGPHDRAVVVPPDRPLGSRRALRSAARSDGDGEDLIDTNALVKYGIAALTQLSLFAGAFKLLDLGIATANVDPSSVPFPAVAFLFYAASLKSRALNPLNNQRPKLDEVKESGQSGGFRDRVTPSWTPPGVFFPIMWILIIGPVRAYSSAVIFESTGTFCDVAHLSFILHLTVGDVWNTINNTECRYGASVVGVLGVVASVAFASYQYYMVDPTAGTLLGATSLWLCTAAALIVDTWRLNPRSNGERDPLYPVLGDTKTEFAWLSSSE